MGNEGNLYGSINYPAENINVISIGALDYIIDEIYNYSSWGPSLNSIINGVGLIKPNFVLIGNKIMGASIDC